jgi:hypothetical protein
MLFGVGCWVLGVGGSWIVDVCCDSRDDGGEEKIACVQPELESQAPSFTNSNMQSR